MEPRHPCLRVTGILPVLSNEGASKMLATRRQDVGAPRSSYVVNLR